MDNGVSSSGGGPEQDIPVWKSSLQSSFEDTRAYEITHTHSAGSEKRIGTKDHINH